MPTNFVPDNNQSDFIDGVDRHFYENQVGASSPFDETFAFRLAAAVAKDRARHQLVRAIRKADEDARFNRSTGQELGDVLRGNPDGSGIKRSIDGVDGASDNAIKL